MRIIRFPKQLEVKDMTSLRGVAAVILQEELSTRSKGVHSHAHHLIQMLTQLSLKYADVEDKAIGVIDLTPVNRLSLIGRLFRTLSI